VKTTIIALSAAVLIAAAPAVFAEGVSSKTASAQHKVSRKHHPGVNNYALRREMQVKGRTMGYPGAFGYAPGAPVVRNGRFFGPDQAPGGAGATPGPGGGNTSVTTGQQAFGANGNPELPVPNLSGTGPSTSGGGAAGGGGGGGGGGNR
jgi:hypothetical protein